MIDISSWNDIFYLILTYILGSNFVYVQRFSLFGELSDVELAVAVLVEGPENGVDVVLGQLGAIV